MPGPYIGPRGGKWADPEHTIPWKDGEASSGERDVPQMSFTFKEPCKQCGGDGKLTVKQARFFGGEDSHTTTCRRCGGSGNEEDAAPRKKSRARMQKSIDAVMAAEGYVPFVDLDVDLPIEELAKGEARGGKYIKRVPYTDGKGRRRYRYYYRESASAREAQAGEEIKLGDRVAKVLDVDGQGNITLQLGGRKRFVTPSQWSRLVAKHYGKGYYAWAEKRATQALKAVSAHLPADQLDDLPGGTDAERMKALEARVGGAYEKLKGAFARAGLGPFAAKRVLADVAQRDGWSGPARAAAVGAVVEKRVQPTRVRRTLDAAENLAEGEVVQPAHVAAAVELGSTFDRDVDQLLRNAEREVDKLKAVLAKAHEGGNREKAEALATALSSFAMQKLALLSTAFPDMKDRIVDGAREVLAEVPSVAPRKEPTREGAETHVYVAGEGGRPVALKAKYKLIDASELMPSHNPKTFSKNAAYPEDVQERAYHRDTSEQAKVIRNAQKLEGQFVVNTNPDAVNGPPVIAPNGVVLGGNSRSMSMQLAYSDFPERAEAMKKYLSDHAHEVGFTADDVAAIKNPVLVREVETDHTDKRNMQLLVRQMNESFTQGMDPRTMQVAMGRKLSDGALKTLANDMGEDETLSDYLSGPKSEAFVNALFRDGIIDARNSNQYVTKGTRQLNADGQTLVARILVGRIVNNADVLSETRPKMIDSIARAVPYLVQAKSHGDGFDISGDLNVALDAYNDLQRKARAGVITALDPKMSPKQFDDLFEHFRVLPGMGEPHPVTSNPNARKLMEVLVRKSGPVQMAGVFREYAKLAAKHPEGQGGLFGDSLSPREVLDQALKEQLAKSLRKAGGEVSEGDSRAFIDALHCAPMMAPDGIVAIPMLPDIPTSPIVPLPEEKSTLSSFPLLNYRPAGREACCANCSMVRTSRPGALVVLNCGLGEAQPEVGANMVCDSWQSARLGKSIATTIAEPQPLPDPRYVYGYDVSENREKEAEAQANRRRAERDYIAHRFGPHGSQSPNPELRYEPAEWPTVESSRDRAPAERVDQTSEATRRIAAKFTTINPAVAQPQGPRSFMSAGVAEAHRRAHAPWGVVVQLDRTSAGFLGLPPGMFVIVDPASGRVLE